MGGEYQHLNPKHQVIYRAVIEEIEFDRCWKIYSLIDKGEYNSKNNLVSELSLLLCETLFNGDFIAETNNWQVQVFYEDIDNPEEIEYILVYFTPISYAFLSNNESKISFGLDTEKSTIEKLERVLNNLVEKEHYEEAAVIKKRIEKLKKNI